MSSEEKQSDISKTAAKRKYLLTDLDLEEVPFKMKPNPLNKNYAPMKVYDKSTLEKIAIEKHGSLEVITTKHEDKSQAINTKLLNKEKKTKELWNSDELFEPLKEFMSDISLPAEKQGVGKAGAETKQKYTVMTGEPDDLLNHNVVIHYFDCMHNRAKGAGSYAVHHALPEVTQLDKKTSFNDRRKMGHFIWLLTESDQLVIIVYVMHKFPKLAANRPVVPVMNYDALQLGLKRLSCLLEKKLSETRRTTASLSIGTYLPYQVDQNKLKDAFKHTFSIPVTIYNITQQKTRDFR